MKQFACYGCGWILDILSSAIIATRECREPGRFLGYFWYELRARRGIIPYND